MGGEYSVASERGDASLNISLKMPEDLKISCTTCGTSLQFLYRGAHSTTKTLKGDIVEVKCYYKCPDSSCPDPFKWAPVSPFSLPNKRFGLDVWCWVVFLRFHAALGYPRVVKFIETYAGLRISVNAVRDICQHYMAASSIHYDEKLHDELKDKKHIILSVDGIKPEKGTDGLYIVRDVLSDTFIHGEYLENASKDRLADLLEVAKNKCPVPIVGIVSDKEDALVKACGEIFPGVRHQYCQFHFLSNVAKPVTEGDRSLKRGLRSEINNIPFVKYVPKKKVAFSPGCHK